MSKPIVRLRPHPVDAEVLEVLTPPEIASTMGRYQPARYDRMRRCYAIHSSDLEAFMLFARLNGLHVVDEPRQGQPARLDGHCPCGEPGCTRNRTVTAEQAEINRRGLAKLRAAIEELDW